MEPVVRVQRHVTYAAAARALEAGVAKAAQLGTNAAIVVTDTFGEIVAAARTDGANPKAWRGGHAKATAAAAMGRTTEEFVEQRLRHDEVLWRAMSAHTDVMLVPGGVPLLFDGASVGGVGVSGGHYEKDAIVAQAVADRFAELVAAVEGAEAAEAEAEAAEAEAAEAAS